MNISNIIKRGFATLTLLGLTATMAQTANAAPSINDMQGCQAILNFIDGKLDPAPAKYNAADVKIVRSGLSAYNAYIQKEIVTPGLLKFNGGDKAKAKTMQAQVDAYKASVVQGYNARYPQDRLFMDHAISVNDCAKQAVPAGADLQALKDALGKMVELSKLN